MRRKIILIAAQLFLALSCAFAKETATEKQFQLQQLEPIKKEDRVLILAPHPDDEAIACAGVIQEAVKAGAGIRVAYLTNGDHNQLAFIVYEKRITVRKNEFLHMGRKRREEAIKAMQLLGVNKDNLTFLGYPDFGTFAIFRDYWHTGRPFKSLLTRVSSVPYKEDFSFGSPYVGESILEDLKRIIRSYKPNKIFVSHPADVNRDHMALALFLEIALADLEKEIKRPLIYPYLVHVVGWPLPRHYHPELSLFPPKKFQGSQINWFTRELSREQVEMKHQAVLRYKTQTESSAFYLLSFCRKNELFGSYPEISLAKPAAPGGFWDGPGTEISPNLYDTFLPETGEGGNGDDDLSADRDKLGYCIEEGRLVVTIETVKKVSPMFGVMFYVFGYSYEKPFALMPKLRIVTRHKRVLIVDKRKRIKPEGVFMETDEKGLTLKIPLKVLGDPDFLLVSAKAYSGTLPAEAIGFRKINIKRGN